MARKPRIEYPGAFYHAAGEARWQKDGVPGSIAMELMYRLGGVSQPEIGKVMGDLDYTAVSRERKLLREKSKPKEG
jgi:hypothetical protein